MLSRSRRPSKRAGLVLLVLSSCLALSRCIVNAEQMNQEIDYEWWRTNHPIQFSQGYGDYMVLQRAPASASVTGHLGTADCPTDPADRPMVVVSIHNDAEDYAHHPSPAIYSIEAEVYIESNLGNKYCSYRATFPPTKTGGSYTFEARYMVTTPDKTATIRHVTFGDVWYCAGQSNMALSLTYTMSRNISSAKVKNGEYDNIRIHGLEGNMNVDQPWATVRDAVEQGKFLDYSATCYYFAEKLTDELREDAGGSSSPPPIGLIHTAWGGSTIEDWLDVDTLASCDEPCFEQSRGYVSPVDRKGFSLFEWNALPYVNMTIKGWLWYQGENNMGWQTTCNLGNSERNVGYSCLMVGLVSSWRKLWSETPGTTDPEAPFGVVALPCSGSEGNHYMGLMRCAQTGSYGVLPNPAMPNTFLAQAYDIDEPYHEVYTLCMNAGCCYPATGLDPYFRKDPQCSDSVIESSQYVPNEFQCSTCDELCGDFCKSVRLTHFRMGPIHVRSKYPLGSRLAMAAARSVYNLGSKHGGSVALTGPTLAGCSVDNEAQAVKIFFNASLLSGDTVVVQAYDHSYAGRSKMEVLTSDASDNGLCLQKIGNKCVDDGHGNQIKWEGRSDPLIKTWTPVDILTQGDATNGGFEVLVDLSSVNASNVIAIRYAWEGSCCWSEHESGNSLEIRSRHCPLKSCPIYSQPSGLPANTFLAEIVDGRCKCISPQTCDGDGTLPVDKIYAGLVSRIRHVHLVPSSSTFVKGIVSILLIVALSAFLVVGMLLCRTKVDSPRRGRRRRLPNEILADDADETEMVELVDLDVW